MDFDRSKLEMLLPLHVQRHGVDRVLANLERFGVSALDAMIALERSWKNAGRQPPDRPAVNIPRPLSQPDPDPEPPPASSADNSVKIWPVVGLAAIQAYTGGAWRAWSLARHLDKSGAGKVARAELLAFLVGLGVNERTRRRWIEQALELELFREYRGTYYLVSLENACTRLGNMGTVGKPALVSAEALASKGWRSRVWSAYLATLGERPISQARKAEITGIDPRTQRNYQASVPGFAISNYADRGRANSGLLGGLRDVCGMTVFVSKRGRLIQRLPDGRHVPRSVSRPCPKGRSRKAQKAVNVSFFVEREPCGAFRLFHDNHKGIAGALHKISRSDNRPEMQELFERTSTLRGVQNWQPVPVFA